MEDVREGIAVEKRMTSRIHIRVKVRRQGKSLPVMVATS